MALIDKVLKRINNSISNFTDRLAAEDVQKNIVELEAVLNYLIQTKTSIEDDLDKKTIEIISEFVDSEQQMWSTVYFRLTKFVKCNGVKFKYQAYINDVEITYMLYGFTPEGAEITINSSSQRVDSDFYTVWLSSSFSNSEEESNLFTPEQVTDVFKEKYFNEIEVKFHEIIKLWVD
jgi:hypothetical protein